MAEIKVLDKFVAELIAAGEVVDRPSSVVKELVENAIDAGATVVTVEIRRGGITFIRVTDNGCGIERDYVATAFLRHATSKISTQEDLDSIHTLGFRGEALASISAVSHVELLTRPSDSQVGTHLVCEGGEIVEISDAGCPAGTTMIVRDIFYNTPARMKFLKKDSTEGNAVAGILDKIALSHPEISFRLIRDGKEVLHTPGDNVLRSAVYAVFGRDFTDHLLPVEYEFQNIKITGFVTLPSAARPNRTMQNFFLNGRYIRSKTACVALEEAFKGSVMVGKFPGCVLHFQLNCAAVDVNVHPAKLEVRFVNEKPIFDAVYHAVKSSLAAMDRPKELLVHKKGISPFLPQEKPEQISFPQPAGSRPERRDDVPSKTKVGFWGNRSPVEETKGIFGDADTSDSRRVLPDTEREKLWAGLLGKTPQPPVTRLQDTGGEAVSSPAAERPSDQQESVFAVEKGKAQTCGNREENASENKGFQQIFSSASGPLRVVGEVFDTYIILQSGTDQLMLIDKHAAHERLLYEKLLKLDMGKEAQQLLSPITVTLDQEDYDAALGHLELLQEAGFEVEDFGGSTLLVRSVPILLEKEDVVGTVAEAAHYLAQHKEDITTEYMAWLYHNIACRAAVKAGDKSNLQELVDLAEQLRQNPEVRYCPHGRPIFVLLSKRELEKSFGRA